MTELIKLHELLKVPISAYFESYDRRTLQLIVFQAPDKAHVNPEPTVLGGAIYAQEDSVVGRYPFRIFCEAVKTELVQISLHIQALHMTRTDQPALGPSDRAELVLRTVDAHNLHSLVGFPR